MVRLFSLGVVAMVLSSPLELWARGMARICMTEWHGYKDSTEQDYRTRFGYYEELGVETLRLGSTFLQNPKLVRALKDTDFKIKVILDPTFITHHYKPKDRMVDQFGTLAKSLGPWNTDFEEATRKSCERELKAIKRSGLADRVDEVVVGLGPASEPMYPANWTLGRSGEEGFWCYSDAAQQSFRRAMAKKYRTLDRANDYWGLKGEQRFKKGSDIHIPKPGTEWAKGQFWDDMLYWYRDCKRQMILHRVRQTEEQVDKYLSSKVKLIVYLPGHAYTQQQWDNAVKHASGDKSIRLMMDNDWLMKEAIKRGCILQYTGVENAKEVDNIVSKLKAMGQHRAYRTMWGENAGVARVGQHPMQLADVITKYNLRGIDFTWSKWLFDEEDGVTPTPVFEEFRRTVEKIRNHYD